MRGKVFLLLQRHFVKTLSYNRSRKSFLRVALKMASFDMVLSDGYNRRNNGLKTEVRCPDNIVSLQVPNKPTDLSG